MLRVTVVASIGTSVSLKYGSVKNVSTHIINPHSFIIYFSQNVSAIYTMTQLHKNILCGLGTQEFWPSLVCSINEVSYCSNILFCHKTCSVLSVMVQSYDILSRFSFHVCLTCCGSATHCDISVEPVVAVVVPLGHREHDVWPTAP